jgi:hypothetical protein
MNPDLSQLRDIHLPDPVSWWPLAPGWWGLFALLMLLSGICVWFYKRFQSNRWREHALIECRTIKNLLGDESIPELASSVSSLRSAQRQAAQQVSALLRRVAITRFPRHEVASLTGQNWIDFLSQAVNHKIKIESSITQTLLYAPYSSTSVNPIAPLLKFAEDWIKALPKKTQWNKQA